MVGPLGERIYPGSGVQCGGESQSGREERSVAQGDRFAKEIGRHTEGAVEKVSPWIERLARVGYAAHGTVYALVGVLALQAAFGAGKTANQEGALRWVLLAPLGKLLLGVIVLGLLAYALWRLFQGLLDPEKEGTDAKGIAKRLDHGLNGLFHASLAFSAGLLALGASGGGGGGSLDDWTARLMAQPLGRWLTVIVGLVIVGIGLFQFYKAYKADFRDELKLGEMSAREDTWATRVGRLGYAARGVVLGVIGTFLVQAALQTQPDKARGLGGALRALARQPFGPYVLGAVAFGLVAYGAFMFVMARYRKIKPT
jgi:Domain of Unknown Function (DUF1206)